jgi:hypothetical protein
VRTYHGPATVSYASRTDAADRSVTARSR